LGWVPCFSITKQILGAKRALQKSYEIRKVDRDDLQSGMSNRTVGDFHYYNCRGGGRGNKPSLWELDSKPVLHESIYRAVRAVGFKTLLPWTSSLHECVIELVSLMCKPSKPTTIYEALYLDQWADQGTMFMTFRDVEVSIDTVQSILAFRPHFTIE
jgi:hypothetical protein